MLTTHPPKELAPNLWMFGTAEYPAFCFRDHEDCALFEGSVSAAAPSIARHLAAQGIPGASVKQLVITHAHPDHVMGVFPLRQQFPGIAVLASEIAARTLAVEKAVAFFCKIDQALAGSLRAAGSIAETDQPQPPAEMKIPVDRTLQEGDVVEVGQAHFAVLATPGHSDCSLSFHEATKGILIISDATGFFLPDHNWWWPNYFTGYGVYLDSIRRLAALNTQVLCLSHNAAIQGDGAVADYFKNALAATEAYHQHIVEAVRGATSPRELAATLGGEVHAKSPLLPLDFFQKNCALLIKQSLQHAGIQLEGSA